MNELAINNKPFNLVQKFVESNFNVDFFKNIDNLSLTINTKGYDLEIDANIAKTLISYQDCIYRTYCIAKYGKENLEKLTLDEKQKLCLKFKIKKGSTDYEAVLGIFKEMYELTPEPHRIYLIIIWCLTLLGGLNIFLFWKYRIQKSKQLTFDKKEETVQKAMDKLSEIAQTNERALRAAEYALRKEKEIVKSLNEAGSTVIINGEKYHKTELETLDELYSKRDEVTSTSKSIKGKFNVSSIDVENPYKIMLRQGNEKYNASYDPKYIDKNVLMRILEGIKAKQAVEVDAEINIYTEDNKKEISIIDIR